MKSKKVFRDIVLLCIVKPFKVLTTIRYYFSMLPRNFAIARYQTLFPTSRNTVFFMDCIIRVNERPKKVTPLIIMLIA